MDIMHDSKLTDNFFYSSALKKWGYTGFATSFSNSIILRFLGSINQISILFPLNILRMNGQNSAKFYLQINIDKI